MKTPRVDHNLLLPVWKGDICYEETGLFRSASDEIPTLYKPTKIISVTSYTKETTYEEGVDFEVTRYGIKRTEGSRIPVLSEDILYSKDLTDFMVTVENRKTRNTLYSEGTTYPTHQVRITYEHAPTHRTINVGEHKDRFARFISKLERGEDVTVFFFGDSISFGYSSSSLVKIPPYNPQWPILVTMALAEKYGYGIRYADFALSQDYIYLPYESDTDAKRYITYVNTSIAGWALEHAVKCKEQHLIAPAKEYGCDLFVLGFAMNNRDTSERNFRELMRELVNDLLAIAPHACVTLLSSMHRNPFDMRRNAGIQPFMEEIMYALADELYYEEGKMCAVSPMNTVSRFILGSKRFIDTTGNGINHPNDYYSAVYAQTVLATLGVI